MLKVAFSLSAAVTDETMFPAAGNHSAGVGKVHRFVHNSRTMAGVRVAVAFWSTQFNNSFGSAKYAPRNRRLFSSPVAKERLILFSLSEYQRRVSPMVSMLVVLSVVSVTLGSLMLWVAIAIS